MVVALEFSAGVAVFFAGVAGGRSFHASSMRLFGPPAFRRMVSLVRYRVLRRTSAFPGLPQQLHLSADYPALRASQQQEVSSWCGCSLTFFDRCSCRASVFAQGMDVLRVPDQALHVRAFKCGCISMPFLEMASSLGHLLTFQACYVHRICR